MREYANGDYSMVRAFLVASGFGPDGLPGTRRDYVVGKPVRARSWSDVTAVEYLVDGDGNVSFEEVGRPDAPF